jgi:hypothetical protein
MRKVDSDTQFFTISDDYFGYALYAFYIFNEQERKVVETDTIEILHTIRPQNKDFD